MVSDLSLGSERSLKAHTLVMVNIVSVVYISAVFVSFYKYY